VHLVLVGLSKLCTDGDRAEDDRRRHNCEGGKVPRERKISRPELLPQGEWRKWCSRLWVITWCIAGLIAQFVMTAWILTQLINWPSVGCSSVFLCQLFDTQAKMLIRYEAVGKTRWDFCCRDLLHCANVLMAQPRKLLYKLYKAGPTTATVESTVTYNELVMSCRTDEAKRCQKMRWAGRWGTVA